MSFDWKEYFSKYGDIGLCLLLDLVIEGDLIDLDVDALRIAFHERVMEEQKRRYNERRI